MGIPWDDCYKAGNLPAVKVVFNEWIAYGRMKEMVDSGALQPRTVMPPSQTLEAWPF